MNKENVLGALIEQLKESLELLKAAALEAKEAATDEESKAENQYDTRGLEASYLAGAQAKRVGELVKAIQQLELLKVPVFSSEDRVQVSALVKVEVDGERVKHFFLLPYGGGTKLNIENQEVFIITPTSPVGRALIGKSVGEDFDLTIQSKVTGYEIMEII